jgi:hypothetical protein
MSGGPQTTLPLELPEAFGKAARRDSKTRWARPPAPFSLRLSAEERAQLERDAGGLPLGEHIRRRVLGEDRSARRRIPRRPSPDHELLARVLSELGRSRLASNLNQLAKAANAGALPVTPDTEAALAAACSDVRVMRMTLLRALGLIEDMPDAGSIAEDRE